MSVQRNNETGKQSSGSGSGGRGPNWLGWIVILAVIGMMGAALVLSVDRMREIPIASGPTATPKPRIGSIAVEPQVEPGENDTGDATVDAAGGEGEAAAQPVGEAGDMPSGSETESAGGATGAQAGTISSAGTGAMSTAPEGEPDSGVELLIVGPIIIPAAPASVRLEGLGVAPTATGVAAAAVTVGDAASATSAFGRIRTSEDTATTEPDSSGAPADAGDVLPATSPESTETPLPTVADGRRRQFPQTSLRRLRQRRRLPRPRLRRFPRKRRRPPKRRRRRHCPRPLRRRRPLRRPLRLPLRR